MVKKNIRNSLFLLLLLLLSCRSYISKQEVSELYYNLGNSYLEQGKSGDAEKCFRRALYFNSKLSSANYNLAKIFIVSGKVDDAIKIIEEILSKEPDNAVYLKLYGYAFYKLGNVEKSLSIYDDILKRDKNDKEARFNRAVILQDKGEVRQAKEEFLYIKEIDSEFKNINSKIGILYFDVQDYSNAVSYLEPLLEKDELDNNSKIILAKAYTKEKYYGKAIDIYNSIIESKPENSEACFEKAAILLTAIADEKEGMNLLKKAIELGYRDKEMYLELLNNSDLVAKEALRELLLSEKIIQVEKPANDSEQPVKSD